MASNKGALLDLSVFLYPIDRKHITIFLGMVLIFLVPPCDIKAQCGVLDNFMNFCCYDLTPTIQGPSGTQTAYATWGGDYHKIDVVSGESYQISTCNSLYAPGTHPVPGGGQNTPWPFGPNAGISGYEVGWDPQMTLVNGGTAAIVANNDDFCGVFPEITYTATFTGELFVVMDTATKCDQFEVDSLVVDVTWLFSLPVEYQYWNAYWKSEGRSVVLDWTTASETNNDYFEIQRSFDSKNYYSIGKVDGAGTTTFQTSYRYTDEAFNYILADATTVYYRLKQVDLDGVYNFSEVRTLKLNTTEPSLSIYPNPASEEVSINFQVPPGEQYTLKITDLLGKTVWSQPTGQSSGNVSLPVQYWQPGLYFVEISNGSKPVTKKLLIN